ncbi:MAG: Mpo1-like protein [Pseudomonadota bacterium]|nr:Mpo1-like protein [Pseudomonadota bacterium]
METRFDSFTEFYPYYLGEHANRICRRLHFAGSTLIVLIVLATIFGALRPLWLFTLPLVGYGFAWLGHFGFEKNRPATFKHPLYSLAGDWVMFKDMLIGKIAL